MKDSIKMNLQQMKYGIVLALITLCYGFGLGGAFGAFEDNIKDHLKSEAKSVLSDVYKGDEGKMKKIASKSWVYFKRAHLHANGLGVIALGLILFLSFFEANNKIKTTAALCLGLGSLGYSTFWMFAGLIAPGMGSTGMAKESLKFLAIPSAGLCITGLAMVMALVVMSLFVNTDNPE